MNLGRKDLHEEFSAGTLLLSSSQSIVEEVVTNEAAIGYLGMGYAGDRTRSIRVAKEPGHFFSPTVDKVLSKDYPLSRGLYFYTNGEPQGTAKLFIDFTMSPSGQQRFRTHRIRSSRSHRCADGPMNC